ncbi:MAG: hypothetical protein IJI41_09900 [Anaerolineaceae bacterium]|nr:hypothetical protein [Anaerolineaceae bacterium]
MDNVNWTPGENCDVILTHYKHGPIPLVCYRIPSDPVGPRVRIHFETYWPEDAAVSRETEPKTVRHLWFTVLVTEEMLCPDGGWYPYDPAEIRKRINEILLELTDIVLYTQSGIISGLYCDEHAVIDTIYQNAHTLEINLTTRSLKDIPLGPTQANTWLPKGVLEPVSVWGSAVWK